MTAPFLEYSDTEHRYFADGRELISVTQVLNIAGLVSPFCMQEEARWRGSEVHRLCAVYDGEGLDLRTVPAKLRGYIKAWKAYRHDSGFAPTLIEQRVDDHVNRYAGRIDRVGNRRDADWPTIIDLKTGAVPDYTRYQLAAYAHGLRPNHIFERIGVQLKPDGRYSVKVFDRMDFNADLARFLQMLKTAQEDYETNINDRSRAAGH